MYKHKLWGYFDKYAYIHLVNLPLTNLGVSLFSWLIRGLDPRAWAGDIYSQLLNYCDPTGIRRQIPCAE